jgi:hypothetical protein
VQINVTSNEVKHLAAHRCDSSNIDEMLPSGQHDIEISPFSKAHNVMLNEVKYLAETQGQTPQI